MASLAIKQCLKVTVLVSLIVVSVASKPVQAVAEELPLSSEVTPVGGFVGGGSDEAAPDHPLFSLPFTGAFVASLSMIIVSEFGDKTFFIAAIMAMRQSRTEIFLSAMTALVLMTILSAVMGLTLPHLLDPKVTSALATILFFFFGVKLLWDAYQMDPNANGAKDEIEEVEVELEKMDSSTGAAADSAQLLESGLSSAAAKKKVPQWKSFLTQFFSPIFIQCFTMTFLAEWGDRSQIATIALAAAKNPIGVSVGAVLGHCVCTSVAVLGGKLLASRISERTIAFIGGMLFLVFAVHSVVTRQ